MKFLTDIFIYFFDDINKEVRWCIEGFLISLILIRYTSLVLTDKKTEKLFFVLKLLLGKAFFVLKKINCYLIKQAEFPVEYPKIKIVLGFFSMLFFYFNGVLFIFLLFWLMALFSQGHNDSLLKSILIPPVFIIISCYFIKFYFAQAEKIRLKLKGSKGN
ncbi:hypothetical protein [Dickeya zeae]|uniref:hypothetical protein n=1 Tax=Dickeya zeae TaxID=204042 RepID=UPI00204FF2A7|nr:hypothetical protein [Dickeya zeae]UPT57568.1 hypothetical protein FGI00_19405 [Dickeya zeae]